MEVKGKLVEIFETQQVSASFKKREFVLEYAENPQYPEVIKFELIQDKCDLLDTYQIGQEVTVAFNLKGRKWVDPKGEAKYFNSLQGWRISAAQAGGPPSSGNAAAAPSGSAAPAPASKDEPEWLNAEDGDDLPF